MATLADIMQRAMGQTITQTEAVKTAGTQRALSRATSERLTKQLSSQIEEFNVQEKRAEETTALEALLNFMNVRGTLAMRAGGGGRTPFDMSKLRYAEDSKTKIVTQSGVLLDDLDSKGVHPKIRTIAQAALNKTVGQNRIMSDYFIRKLNDMPSPDVAGGKFKTVRNVVIPELPGFTAAYSVWHDTGINDATILKTGEMISGVEVKTTGWGAELTKKVLTKENGYYYGHGVTTAPENFYIVTEATKRKGWLSIPKGTMQASGTAYLKHYIAKLLPTAYSEILAIPEGERDDNQKALFSLLSGINGSYQQAAAEYAEAVINPMGSRLKGNPLDVDTILGGLGIRMNHQIVNPASSITAQLTAGFERYRNIDAEEQTVLVASRDELAQKTYAAANNLRILTLGKDQAHIFVSLGDLQAIEGREYKDHIKAEEQEWINSFDKSGLKDMILEIHGDAPLTGDYDDLSLELDADLKNISFYVKAGERQKAVDIIDGIIDTFIPPEGSGIGEFPGAERITYDFLDKFTLFFNGQSGYGLPPIWNEPDAQNVRRFYPFTEEFKKAAKRAAPPAPAKRE